MRTIVVLLLAVGFASSAILDNKSSSKTDWDDGDSMILSASKDPVKSDKVSEDSKPSPILSILPVEKTESPQDGGEVKEKNAEISNTTPEDSQEAQDSQEQIQQTTNASGEDDSTESPRLAVIQLGKIPLTFEIIPLLRPDEGSTKQTVKSVGFFPEQVAESVTIPNVKEDSAEKEKQKPDISEEADSTPTRRNDKGDGTEDVPREPLRYMVPPRPDEETPWNKYPLPSGSATGEEDQYKTTIGTDPEPQMISTMGPPLAVHQLNSEPIQLQKWEDFPKVESHSTDGDEGVSEEPLETSTETQSAQETSTPLEDGIPFTTLTPPPAPLQGDNGENAWTQMILPTPGQPEIRDYYEPQPQPEPKYPQYPEVRPVAPYYPRIPMMSPSDMMLPPKPMRPMVIQREPYWPRKYISPYENEVAVDPNSDYYNPFMRYRDYYRSARSMFVPSSQPAASPFLTNSINNEEERTIPMGYDDTTYYRSPNYYSQYPSSPSSYVMNYRPMIRYRPSYYARQDVNDMMYAPMYPYQQQVRMRRTMMEPQGPQPLFY